jgi:hypothetical protein
MLDRSAASSPRPITVFISSTSEDLSAYRGAAKLAVLDTGCTPRMMEHFGALAAPTVDACLNAVANCDVFLLIVAHRRGWVPSPEQGGNGHDSITALELQHARRLHKPVFILLASTSWPGDRWEDDAAQRDYVKMFRAELNQPAAFFDAEPEAGPEQERLPIFRAKVRDILQKHRTALAQSEASARTNAGGDLRLEAVSAGLRSGSRIPLLGPAVFAEREPA